MNSHQQIKELKLVYTDIASKIFELQKYHPQSSDEVYQSNLELTHYMNELISVEKKLSELYISLAVDYNFKRLEEASKLGKNEFNRIMKELFKDFPKVYNVFEDK